MSLYATLWQLKLPRRGDAHTGCEWIEVVAQGVPAHIGTPTPGFGYEGEDPYASFLSPKVTLIGEAGPMLPYEHPSALVEAVSAFLG